MKSQNRAVLAGSQTLEHRRRRSQRRFENKLNELSGKDWIKFTKSWFIHRPKPRGDSKIRHPASFPESLVREFIQFFTKPRDLVVDPFLGTGSTLVASIEVGRSGVGFEIVAKYARVSKERVANSLRQMSKSANSTGNRTVWAEVVRANSKKLSEVWNERKLPQADYCITSPPYWNQLKRNTIRQRDRIEKGLDTKYSNNPEEIGNVTSYQDFLRETKQVFDEVYKVMKPKGYLTIITNNVFADGRMYPLAFDMVSTLSHSPYSWTPKDEKIWLQDDKALLPLGVYNAWVGNRHHQYCLIFRKENGREQS